MRDSKCEIGTLAAHINDRKEHSDSNIVKVNTKEDLNSENFLE